MTEGIQNILKLAVAKIITSVLFYKNGGGRIGYNSSIFRHFSKEGKINLKKR